MKLEGKLCVTTHEAAELLRTGSYAYLDVRGVQEFELGHVPGALNIPFRLDRASAPNPDFVRHVVARFARRDAVIVGCQSGVRSRAACAALREVGFEHVVEHAAGLGGVRDEFGQMLEVGWERAGLPLSYVAAPGCSYRELSRES